MILRLALVASLTLFSCGYHLVGHGTETVIPEGVSTATLETLPGVNVRNLLEELKYLWRQKSDLPALSSEKVNPEQVTLRIEGSKIVFTASAFDASGLAIQYRLSISAALNMYQHNSLIWSSGDVIESADIFEGADPSVTEAERERYTEQLNKEWAKDVLSRLRSGF